MHFTDPNGEEMKQFQNSKLPKLHLERLKSEKSQAIWCGLCSTNTQVGKGAGGGA